MGSLAPVKTSSSSARWDRFSLLGDCVGVCVLLAGLPGVFGRIMVDGEGGADGRRNGEERGEPKERGDGLYGVVLGVTCELF